MKKQKIVIVCIDSHPKTISLIKTAYLKAKSTNSKLEVLYINDQNTAIANNKLAMKYINFSKRKGAVIQILNNSDVVKGIADFINSKIKNKNIEIESIFIGKRDKGTLKLIFSNSITNKVKKQVQNKRLKINTVSLDSKYELTKTISYYIRKIPFKSIIKSLILVFFALIISETLRINYSNNSIQEHAHDFLAFFLVATSISSHRWGLIPGLISTLASFVVIDYSYTPPVGDIAFNISESSLGLQIFLLSSIVITIIGARDRANFFSVLNREYQSKMLASFYKSLHNVSDVKRALKIIHKEMKNFLGVETVFFLPQQNSPSNLEISYPSNAKLKEFNLNKDAYNYCWEYLQSTGKGTKHFSDSKWRYKPLMTPTNQYGVIAIKINDNSLLKKNWFSQLKFIAEQVAFLIERVKANHKISSNKIEIEKEKLRSMMLSSVSHDLKTPLVSIISGLNTHKRIKAKGRLSEDVSEEIINSALEESDRLHNFITNILNMTKIEHDGLKLNMDWIEAESIVNDIAKTLSVPLEGFDFKILNTIENYQIYTDQILLRQVLQNILDNATKYCPKGTKIRVKLSVLQKQFCFSIKDYGKGIPEDKISKIFDKYERLKHRDNQVAGTGLGLAISKAIISKLGGTIKAKNHSKGGVEFLIFIKKYQIIS